MHAWWDKNSNKETFKKILYDGSKDEVSSPMDNEIHIFTNHLMLRKY